MKSTGSKRATLAMTMAMAAQASETTPIDYDGKDNALSGGWRIGFPLTKKQRKARAATKRQRKARQQQRKV